MFFYHLRHAWRRLLREPGFAVAAVLTLALGVGGNVAVFAVVQAALLRPLPYAGADRLVILKHRDQRTGVTKEFIAIGDYVDLLARQSAFEGVAGYGGTLTTIFGQGEPFRVIGLTAAPGLLETLRVRPILGRDLRPEDSLKGAAPVVLLGYDLWQTHFGGDANVVGRGVKIGDQEHQIVGVAPPGFRFPPNARTEIILPMTVPVQAPADRKSDWTFAAARLKPNVTLQQATTNLAVISLQLAQEYPRSNEASEYFAVPLHDAVVGNTKPALVLLLAAVGVVLLIACVNVANLLLVQSLGRQREMAVRMAVGASRTGLAAQLLIESALLATAAGSGGLVIAYWGAHALVTLVPKSVSVAGLTDVHLNGEVLAFALGVSGATALLFGLVSAVTVRRENLTGELASAGRVGTRPSARRAASALVVGEVALATVLLIGAGLVLRSFARLVAVDPGFRTDHIATMEITVPVSRYTSTDANRIFYDRAFAALRALPGVQQVGAAVVVPLTGNNWTVPLERAEHPAPVGQRPPEVGWQVASAGYFKTLQIPVVSGRLFDERDAANSQPVVIVSEAVEQRYFPKERALGHAIKLGKQTWEIVGVVGNIRRADLRDEPRADMYFPFEREPGTSITLFVRTASNPEDALPSLQAALRALEPQIVFVEVRTLADIASESLQANRLVLWLLAVFAATALALAAVGIYGVMSYVVRQRTREFGIRVALGATRRDIAKLVMQQSAGIGLLGTALGLGIGLSSARSLGSILYGISSLDPAAITTATAVLLATVIAACYLPARRAALTDPARTLADL